jgi:sugar transferase (PEP-CTERM/EpsH1 system associated)
MHDTSRPKVLYLVHRFPYPPDKGDRIRNYHLLSWLARRASVDLACLADEDFDEHSVEALEKLADRVAVVRQRAGARWAGALGSFALGRTISEGAFHSRELRDVVRRWARDSRYHVVVASASSLVPYLRIKELDDVPAVVDLVDVDSQKWLDYSRACRGPRAWLYRVEGQRLRRLEQGTTTWARGTLLVSEAETNLLRQACQAPNVHTIPNGVDMKYFRPRVEKEEAGETCVFVGALDYRPNIDGACWFCGQAWPEIRRRHPDARLLLVGRRPVPEVLRLADVPGVDVIGQVPDVRPYLERAAVVVVPLRLARGIQNKVLEALAMGKATVASPQSLAGLRARGSVPVLTASTSEEWAECVSRLLGDPAQRRRLGADGRGYVEEFHHWDRSLEPLGPILGLPERTDHDNASDPEALGLGQNALKVDD